MSLNKYEILAANDADIRAVAVPEWGGSVNVRVMTGKQRDQFEGAVCSRRGKDGNIEAGGLRALLVALTACDDTGALLFSEDDIPQLEAKSAAALQRVFDAAAALNGLSGAASEAARSDFTTDRK